MLFRSRASIDHLPSRGVQDLTNLTLMSDGVSVYACPSPDEVIDLVRGGQGVFGIAVGRVWEEVEGTLATLPMEPLETEAVVEGTDELSLRRAKRHAG